MQETNLWVGIDWAKELHQVCVLDEQGSVVAERQVRHRADALGEFCTWLSQLAEEHGARPHVAIETRSGPLVELLMERGFAVYAINPKQLDRFRDRFSPSGAKDDRRDALALAASLRTDREAYDRIEQDHAMQLELREHSRMRLDLVREHTRLTHQMDAQLQRYYGAFLELFPDPSEPAALNLWEAVPTPQAAHRTRSARIARILQSNRLRRFSAAEALAKLREAPFVVAPGTVEAAEAHIRLLVARLRLVNRQIRDVEQVLKRHVEGESAESPDGESKQRDAAIMLSVPGIGMITCATLLAEAWRLLRVGDYHGLRCFAGVAPVTRSSGKKRQVAMRTACNQWLRHAVYHWARVAAQRDPASKARYAALRSRGVPHGQALRSVADRLLKALCAMLRSGEVWKPRAMPSSTAA